MEKNVWVLYSTGKRGFVVAMNPVAGQMEVEVSASPKADAVLAFPDMDTMTKVLEGYCLVTKEAREEMFPADRFVPMLVEATESQLEGVACTFGSGEEVL